MDATIATERVKTRSGLVFTTDLAGPAGGELVLMLHGFPQSRHIWRPALTRLAAAGYRAAAPDQRGYSPGARPDPAALASYGFEDLTADSLEIAEACGAGGRFHLVGHDWGGQVSWGVASRHPERLASLAVLSRPHPQAFRRALENDDDGQKTRSRHHSAFLDPNTASLLLEDNARRLRATLSAQGVPAAAAEAQLGVIGSPEALEAALAWYRANRLAMEIGPVAVPTLYVWGDADATVGPKAAAGTEAWVSGPYRFETLPGIGHFVMDQEPEATAALLAEHVKAHPA